MSLGMEKGRIHGFCKIFPRFCILLFSVEAILFFYYSYDWNMDTKIAFTRPKAISNQFAEKTACHFPHLLPFDSSILSYVKKPDPVNCNKSHPLIFVSEMDKKTGKSILIQVKNPGDHDLFNCCYISFTHKDGTKSKHVFSKMCIPIKEKRTEMDETIEFVQINCERENGSKVIADLLGFVPASPKVKSRIKKYLENRLIPPIEKRNVNVAILGLDAVSHMNFIRIMPLTHAYLTQSLSAFKLSGYTKVGENTFPNLVPMLLGKTVSEMEKICWKKDKPFDNCSWIWNAYAAEGRVTAYGEDSTWMGIFNYVKEGFHRLPTDYYINPLTSLMADKIGHKKQMNAKICYGSRLSFDILLDYLKKMALSMSINFKNTKYFQFIWATALFHDYLNNGMMGDEMLLETLKWFNNEGYLNDTIFILMSDHGIRWGDILETLQGRIEEKMPFVYFLLPEWFQVKYQGAVSNLRRNDHRLTTPFDLHRTLSDLLYLENIEDDKLRTRQSKLKTLEERSTTLSKTLKIDSSNRTVASNMPRGISLFLPIPLSRTCNDAGIDDNWCVCQNLKPVSLENNTLAEEAALNVVNVINKKFIEFPQCSKLTLENILNAQVLQADNEKISDDSETITDSNDPRLAKQSITFYVSFSVTPSNATFETSVTRTTNGSWTLGGDISRTNLYGDQSRCVTEYTMKKFCFCP